MTLRPLFRFVAALAIGIALWYCILWVGWKVFCEGEL